IWQTFSPAGCVFGKRKKRAPPDARFDTTDSDRSVFLREHDGEHAGCLLRVARIVEAEFERAVVVIDFPKEPFPPTSKLPKSCSPRGSLSDVNASNVSVSRIAIARTSLGRVSTPTVNMTRPWGIE